MALGDTIYRGSSVWKRLVGNTTTTKKFLRQIGTGSASAAPAWDTIASTDLSDVAAGTSVVPLRDVVPISDAQTKALPTTPITIRALPGSGFIDIPVMVALIGYMPAPYTNIDPAAYLWVQRSDGSDWSSFIGNDATSSPAIAHATTFLTASGLTILREFQDTVTPAAYGWGGLSVPRALPNNLGLRLAMNNGGSGNLTGGGGGNSIKVITYYMREAV